LIQNFKHRPKQFYGYINKMRTVKNKISHIIRQDGSPTVVDDQEAASELYSRFSTHFTLEEELTNPLPPGSGLHEVLSPRPPGESLVTGREERVSAGEDARSHRLSSAIASLLNTYNIRFWHDTISSVFAHTFRYNVTDMPNLSLTRRPPALSRDVRHEKPST